MKLISSFLFYIAEQHSCYKMLDIVEYDLLCLFTGYLIFLRNKNIESLKVVTQQSL